MTKPPSQINVLGIPFEVKVVNKIDSADDWGEMDGPARMIKLKRGQKPEQMASTLLHEICHAVFYVTGHSERLAKDDHKDEEESLVLALEHGLSQLYVLRDSE